MCLGCACRSLVALPLGRLLDREHITAVRAHGEQRCRPVRSANCDHYIGGSSDLSMGWSISVRPSAVGGEHDSESVVIKIFEAVGQPADLLDDQVDGFGSAVGDP
jgi:hypothetical protein